MDCPRDSSVTVGFVVLWMRVLPDLVGASDGGALSRRSHLDGVVEEPRPTSNHWDIVYRVKTQI